jgi:protein-tyrosine phosphatase
MKKPVENSYWVEEGKLLAGEYPVDFLKELIKAGFKCFIDLTASNRYQPYTDNAKNISDDVEVHCFPIKNRSIPKSNKYTIQILDTIDKNLKQNRMVYVHCLAGIGRTGTIVGCWLSRHGYSGKEALLKLNELWLDNPVSKYCTTPETAVQCEYIENWKDKQ